MKKKGVYSEEKEGLGGGRWKIKKKSEGKYYFNKRVCIIDKLMWMFCKSGNVK